MKILYVEDNILDIDLTKRELNKLAPEFEMITVSSLAEGQQYLEQNDSIDLALIDLNLPDGSGIELLNTIRDSNLPIAVVILTGLGDEESAVNALKSGADDYISKQKDYLVNLATDLRRALERYRKEKKRKSRPLRILYAEHNTTDIDLTLKHFKRQAPHIYIDAVHTSSEVINRLFESENNHPHYDVLLLDYQLPGMNGIELVKVLNQYEHFSVPIILVTGHGNEELAVQALRMGIINYVVKHPGYMYKLPPILENAFYSAEIQRERENLAKSEERFRLLAENARDMIYRFRLLPEPGFEYISPSVKRITGYTPEEFYSDDSLGTQLIHPDDTSLLAELKLEQEKEHRLLLRFVRKDGEIIWVEQYITSIFNDQRQLLAFESIARDVTIRQNALNALKASEQSEREHRLLAEALRDSASALISAIDTETVMNTILENVALVVPNDAANIMLIEDGIARPVHWRGYRAERTPDIENISFAIEDVKNLQEMFVTCKPFVASYTEEYENWVHRPLTEWVKSYVGAPIRSHGQVIGFLSLDSGKAGFYNEKHARNLLTFADQASIAIERAQLYEKIQKNAVNLARLVNARTEQLQRSESRYRAIIEDQADLVCRYTSGGILTFVNQTFCEYMNMSWEQLVGKNRLDLMTWDQRSLLETHIASLNSSNQSGSIEIRETSIDGNEQWFHWNEQMLFDEEDNFVEYQGVGRDITDRKLAEEQLQQMLDHAMQIGELKSRYISMAAHDLRNPLAIIQNALDFIRMYSDRVTPEKIQSKYDQVQDAIKIMVNMLNDILTLGRAETGKLAFSPSMIDVIATCELIVEEVKNFTNTSKPINVSIDKSCGSAFLDTNLLRHILSNLLSNAIKYSSEDTSIVFTVECKSDHILFLVQDHGIGIPQADQNRLFEAFHRASNAKKISGTGLGLAIVKQSVELHGGTISFESQENVGTTFKVLLPQNT